MEHGKGIYVYDTEGREYLEATASLGYQNDELADAIAGQYRDLPFFVSGLHRTGKGSLREVFCSMPSRPLRFAEIALRQTSERAR